jgi:DNA-binding NarL/FixJ family response regulator
MLRMVIVEDNLRLQAGLKVGLEATGAVQVLACCTAGEEILDRCLAAGAVDVILMDVALAGEMNGIEAAVGVRRELPRQPVVFYSIQDDDAYYRAFRQSGILSHYAYVRKSNYLLPTMVVTLLKDAVAGRSFIDPEIEARVQQVRVKDQHAPLALLEPNEQAVARLLAQGLTNEQIGARLGFRDKRTISRTNGQIYAAWGLADNTTDEKVARTRATVIMHAGQIVHWDEQGGTWVLDDRGAWVAWDGTL